MPASHGTSAGGYLLVLGLIVPYAGALLGLALGGRYVGRVASVAIAISCVIAAAVVFAVVRNGGAIVYDVGGWSPPLGLSLRADGLSAAMMATVAVVMGGIALYAITDFRQPPDRPEERRPLMFWTLFLAVWGALNAIFVGRDLFNLYVALELLTFAAVPMVCLDGRKETLEAAFRYLLFALLGSMLYLLGAVLIYGGYGTLDIGQLAARVDGEPIAVIAAALMTFGLLAKTALFPFYLWLPPAHAGAPAAASALLSALVVKGSFFLTVRLWFDAMPGVTGRGGAEFLGVLGAGALVLGNVLALRQERLKLMVAYSTVAQIGFLFLMYPVAFGSSGAQPPSEVALAGGMIQVISHGTAKAAMFLAAGSIYAALGHDRTAGLAGAAGVAPISLLAFALGGLALVGMPASGAYLAKALLLEASEGQWWWAVWIQASAVLTSSYVVLVLLHGLMPADEPIALRAPPQRLAEAAALALALCSLLLGLLPWQALLAVPAGTPTGSDFLGALLKALWPIPAGLLVAMLMGRWAPPLATVIHWKPILPIVKPLRSAAAVPARIVEATDERLRLWAVASLCLMALTLMWIALAL